MPGTGALDSLSLTAFVVGTPFGAVDIDGVLLVPTLIYLTPLDGWALRCERGLGCSSCSVRCSMPIPALHESVAGIRKIAIKKPSGDGFG